MKAVVSHDREGTIASLGLFDPGAPPVAALGDADGYVTEVEIPDEVLDLIRRASEDSDEGAAAALRELRVSVPGQAKLVPRETPR